MILVTSFNQEGVFGVQSYVAAFSSPTTYKAMFNTLRMVAGTLLGAWIIGGSLAFLRHKTDFKRKRLLDTFVFLSFTIPAYILSISFIEVVSRGGYLHRFLLSIFPNINYNVNVYTVGASAVILALHLYPLVYYGVGNALKLVGNSLEQSARVCGAKKSTMIFKIVLPLVLPSFISTGLLVVSRSMANFGVPAQVSLPSGSEVLSTRVFSAMSDLNLPVVAVLSLLLIAISVVLFLLSERILKRKRYDIRANITNSEPSYIKLRKFQKPVCAIVITFFVITILIPFITIIVSSFFKRWGLDLRLENMTLGNYAKLFSQENLLTQPLINSLLYGITAALVAAIIASFTVYYSKYKKGPVSNLLLGISQLPIAVPNMILAVAAMFAWINEPFKLYGTGAIIIVTYTVLFIPICIKQMLGASKNLDGSLDTCAQTLGIGLYRRYTKLFIPQIKDSLISGILICFLISLKEIPISLLLYTSNTKTLGVMMFTIQSNSYGLEMTSTISVMVIALSVAGHLILRKIGSKGYKV